MVLQKTHRIRVADFCRERTLDYYKMFEALKKDKFLSELSKDILNHILKNNFLTLKNMALEVSNITDFQKYFDGVMG